MTVSLVEAATEPLMEFLRMEQLHVIIGRVAVRPLSAGAAPGRPLHAKGLPARP
jgi:hypothetical protein